MSTYSSELGAMDIIFVGAGSAACTTAARLAKANPDLKILLIERGRNNFQDPTVQTPALYISHLAPGSTTNVPYKAKPSAHLNGREAIVHVGNILGGSSSINFMVYTRGQAIDYDSWNSPGWTANEMLPLFKKLETFEPAEPGIDKSKHGYSGPVHISDGGYRGPDEADIMKTIKDMGMKQAVDLQNFDDDLGEKGTFSRWNRYVSKDGKRQDAAHCYLHPLLQAGTYPNLHLLLETKVSRVIFDHYSTPPRAIGVEYHSTAGSPSTILASKLVVLAAGALASPQILERSGVGIADLLQKLSIPVVADLAGVGEEYQDHIISTSVYKSALGPKHTMDALWSGRRPFGEAFAAQDPILGWNAIDIYGKLRMTSTEAAALGPEYQQNWQQDFASSPTRPTMMAGIINAFIGDHSLLPAGQYTSWGNILFYPYSRGHIHITSATDIDTGYDFDTGFLSHPSDIKAHLWGYKRAREIARRLPTYRGEVAAGHPSFPDGSKAALVDIDVGDETFVVQGDIEYSPEDDEAIMNWIRETVNTTFHSLGTCAMKPREKGGVVDGDLNVYGTAGLKVADMSVVPENIGGNTYNTALVIGEKAAIIVATELGFEV